MKLQLKYKNKIKAVKEYTLIEHKNIKNDLSSLSTKCNSDLAVLRYRSP